MKSKLENFLILFRRLRKETNNSPTNLTWLTREKPQLTVLCYHLYICYGAILRFFSKKNTKHTVAPDGFSKNWDDYERNWNKIVEEGAGPEIQRVKNDSFAYLRQAEEKAITEGKKREDFWKEIMEEIPREIGWTFDPLVDDPAATMNDIKSAIYDSVDSDLDFFDDKTIGAWLFFEETIGIDYSAVLSRWRSVPELFIPAHTVPSYITPIVELYNEAVRAYVFGLTVASVAMCRALLEHVLKKHYHVQGKDLEKIISDAEAKHKHLRGLALQNKRRMANTVMHKYENRIEDLDQTVVGFLVALRHVVTNIPPRPSKDRGRA